MSGVRMLNFLKDWWKFIQIHQYYTMAFKYGTLRIIILSKLLSSLLLLVWLFKMKLWFTTELSKIAQHSLYNIITLSAQKISCWQSIKFHRKAIGIKCGFWFFFFFFFFTEHVGSGLKIYHVITVNVNPTMAYLVIFMWTTGITIYCNANVYFYIETKEIQNADTWEIFHHWPVVLHSTFKVSDPIQLHFKLQNIATQDQYLALLW